MNFNELKTAAEEIRLPAEVKQRIIYNCKTEDKKVKILNDSNKYPFEILLTYSAQIEIPHPDYPEQNKGSFEI